MTHEGPLLFRRDVVVLLGATGVAWLMTGGLNPRRAVAGIALKDRKSTRLNSSHLRLSRMPSSA